MKKIMVIDDTPDFLALMAMLLENENYRPLIRSTGEGAVQLVKEQEPDLVMLDLRLPDVDGLEVLRKLKKDPDTRSIPAIISTADKDRVKKEKPFIEAYSVGVLEKPYKLDDLQGAVRQAIGHSVKRSLAPTAPSSESAGSRSAKGTAAGSERRRMGLWKNGSAA